MKRFNVVQQREDGGVEGRGGGETVTTFWAASALVTRLHHARPVAGRSTGDAEV